MNFGIYKLFRYFSWHIIQVYKFNYINLCMVTKDNNNTLVSKCQRFLGKAGLPVFFSMYSAVRKLMTCEEHVHELSYVLSPLWPWYCPPANQYWKGQNLQNVFIWLLSLLLLVLTGHQKIIVLIHCLFSLLSTSTQVCVWAKQSVVLLSFYVLPSWLSQLAF